MTILQGLPRTGRGRRYPRHPFLVRSRAYAICPFLIAPVLAGETLRKALVQARVVSDPITDPLTGWHMEYYIYYVPVRALPGADDFKEMFLDPSKDLSAYEASSENSNFYQPKGGMEWVEQCLQAVVQYDFRQEGELWDDWVIGPYPAASISQQSLTHSLVSDTNMAQAMDLDVDLNADSTVTAGEIEQAMAQYQFLRQHGVVQMDFDDYIRAFGVRKPVAEESVPELIRMWREWHYPVNTIDPSDGSPTSAISGAVSFSADKDRFFKEPGFIFGCFVARPKIYLGKQNGYGSAFLNDAYRWLPAVLTGDSRVSYAKFNGTTTNSPDPGDGPLDELADDYWLDLRDLFIHGEQYTNVLNVTGFPFIGLPESDGNKSYPTETMAKSLFVDTTSANYFRQDGICQLQVSTHQMDTSGQTPTEGA